MAANEKVDLFKLHKTDYAAPKKPKLVTVGRAQYLSVDGRGAPGSEAYTAAVGALYAVAYTLKFACKAEGRDFVVCKLEADYGLDEPIDPAKPESWTWRLMIRVPDFVEASQWSAAKDNLVAKGENALAQDITLVVTEPGTCVQMLHVGPYDKQADTLEVMQAFADSEGHTFKGQHHEVYLSDPRRVEPERLKTILRWGIG